MNRLHTAVAATTVVALSLALGGNAGAAPAHGRTLAPHDDTYRVRAGHTLSAPGLFRNDDGDPITLTSHTSCGTRLAQPQSGRDLPLHMRPRGSPASTRSPTR